MIYPFYVRPFHPEIWEILEFFPPAGAIVRRSALRTTLRVSPPFSAAFAGKLPRPGKSSPRG